MKHHKSPDKKEIKLSKPITIDGIEVKALSMREPTVNDQLSADAVNGGDALKEVHLFAKLCEISPDTIKTLPLKDYKKIQDTFIFFSTDS